MFGVVALADANHVPADSRRVFSSRFPTLEAHDRAAPAEYLGRHCLSLEDGRASLRDFEITDGVIDLDVTGKGARGFLYRIESASQVETSPSPRSAVCVR